MTNRFGGELKASLPAVPSFVVAILMVYVVLYEESTELLFTMGRIELEIRIKAPLEKAFDLARSVEVHMTSTAHTCEKAVAGRTSGLCEQGDTITWYAKHFGVFQYLTVVISSMDRPHHFQDRMLKGAFKGFEHDHYFKTEGEYTVMRDVFDYAAPLGLLGKLAELFFLDRYMEEFLVRRNQVIKTLAETPMASPQFLNS